MSLAAQLRARTEAAALQIDAERVKNEDNFLTKITMQCFAASDEGRCRLLYLHGCNGGISERSFTPSIIKRLNDAGLTVKLDDEDALGRAAVSISW